jgi:hypothetical protein
MMLQLAEATSSRENISEIIKYFQSSSQDLMLPVYLQLLAKKIYESSKLSENKDIEDVDSINEANQLLVAAMHETRFDLLAGSINTAWGLAHEQGHCDFTWTLRLPTILKHLKVTETFDNQI